MDNHEKLLAPLASTLNPGGQLAVEMPSNHDHVSHTTAHEVAREPLHAAALGGYVREYPLREPEWYAELFAHLGFTEQHVREQVYLHRLPTPADVIEWVKGSLLTDYRNRLPPADYEAYLTDYRQRLLSILPNNRPSLYPFKRILLWARMGGASSLWPRGVNPPQSRASCASPRSQRPPRSANSSRSVLVAVPGPSVHDVRTRRYNSGMSHPTRFVTLGTAGGNAARLESGHRQSLQVRSDMLP